MARSIPAIPVSTIRASRSCHHHARRCRRLRAAGLPATVESSRPAPATEVEPAAIVDVLRERGLDVVVCEGGPNLLGGLIGAGLVDELFLTVAPQVAGRSPDAPRLALVEGLAFAIDDAPWIASSP